MARSKSGPAPSLPNNQNKIVIFPFLYGSTAYYVGEREKNDKAFYKWYVYVRSIEGERLDYFIDKVVFYLHETFPNPVRTISATPFIIQDEGWGEFNIKIEVHFKEQFCVEPVVTFHYLKLYQDNGQVVKGRAVVSEVHDELIFVNPLQETERALLEHQSEYIKKDVFKKVNTIDELAHKEQALIFKLSAAHKKNVEEMKRISAELKKRGIDVMKDREYRKKRKKT